jgi:hypothetical protein
MTIIVLNNAQQIRNTMKCLHSSANMRSMLDKSIDLRSHMVHVAQRHGPRLPISFRT